MDNPNERIVNLTRHILSPDEFDVLKLGLRNGLATRPNKFEIMAVAEDVWSQVSRLNAFNGIVLINRQDYITSVKSLFSDSNKFSKLNTDPTLTRLHSLQHYLLTLNKRGEITDTELESLRPITAHFGRAHSLPKTHKEFDTIPKFRPIIDTTNTPHYNVGKFLSNLLHPLTLNDYSLTDSFDAVRQINNIPKHLFQEGYQFVSFDVVSLFTNVPGLSHSSDYFRSNLQRETHRYLIAKTHFEKTHFRLLH